MSTHFNNRKRNGDRVSPFFKCIFVLFFGVIIVAIFQIFDEASHPPEKEDEPIWVQHAAMLESSEPDRISNPNPHWATPDIQHSEKKKQAIAEMMESNLLEEISSNTESLEEPNSVMLCKQTLQHLKISIQTYFNEFNYHPWHSGKPQQKEILTTKNSDVLNQLTHSNPKSMLFIHPQQLNNESLLDPWGKPLRIELHSENPERFTIRSAGPDGKFKTEDDIILQSS